MWKIIGDFRTGHEPTCVRVWSGGFQNVMDRVGSGWVGSGQKVFEISRVGSDRVWKVLYLTDRVGSGLRDPTRPVKDPDFSIPC